MQNKIQLQNYKELPDLLSELKKKYPEYPAKFILVKSAKSWQAIYKELLNITDNIVSLSSYIGNDDTLPKCEEAFNNATQHIIKGQSVLFLPLGEYIRIKGDNGFEILRDIAQFRNINCGHVVIPLFDIEPLFLSAMNRVARYSAGVLPPLIECPEVGQISLTISPFNNIRHSEGTFVVRNFKQYFDLWETEKLKDILFITDKAEYLKNIQSYGALRVKIYQNAYDYLNSEWEDVSLIPRSLNDDKYWKWLLNNQGDAKSFKHAAKSIFNVQKYDAYNLFAKWKDLDKYCKWVLWGWSRIEAPRDSIIFDIANKSESYADLENQALNIPYEMSLSPDDLLSRRTFLDYLGIIKYPRLFWKNYDQLDDNIKKMQVLPGILLDDKNKIISILRNLILKQIDSSVWMELLQISFQDLADYLSSIDFGEMIINKYLELYKLSRICDEPSKELISEVTNAAEKQYFWSLPLKKRGNLLREFDCNNILWVDGMGLEWVSLLLHKLEANSYYPIEKIIRVAYANFPTETEFNKEWSSNENVMREIDHIAHTPDYSFPESFFEQMNAFNKIAQRALEMLNKHDEIIITADHGLSRFALTSGESIPISSLPVEAESTGKYGRYAILSKNAGIIPLDDRRWIVKDGRLLLSCYGRFVSKGGHRGEIHGGATLEETLVPVIHLKKFEEKFAFLNLNVLTDPAQLDNKGKCYIRINIETNRTLKNTMLKIDEKYFPGNKKPNNEWTFLVQDISPGHYECTIICEDSSIGKIDITIKGGAVIEEDLGL